MKKINDIFSTLSRKTAQIAGSWQATIIAITSVIVWTLGGFVFGFTDSYQLVANTGTTLVTFLMVFLIQGAQNRDSRAIQIKLNEIICVLDKADDRLINLESKTDKEIDDADQRVSSQNSSDSKGDTP